MAQDILAPCSYLTTSYGVLQDEVVAEMSDFIRDDIKTAYDHFYDLFDDKKRSDIGPTMRDFPHDIDTLLEACNISSQQTTTTRMKMQSRLTGPAMLHRRDRLRDECDREQHVESAGTTFEDMMHTNLLMGNSQHTRIINSPL